MRVLVRSRYRGGWIKHSTPNLAFPQYCSAQLMHEPPSQLHDVAKGFVVPTEVGTQGRLSCSTGFFHAYRQQNFSPHLLNGFPGMRQTSLDSGLRRNDEDLANDAG